MKPREILESQRLANHALRMKKAKLVLRYIHDLKIHEMWAQIAIDTEELQIESDKADIEARLLTLKEGGDDEHYSENPASPFHFGR